MRVCNPIFPQASQRHDSEKLGTNSVDVKSCESPEVSPGRRLQGRRPTPPGSQATRSKRFANACAAADKEPNCQTLLPWLSSDCHRFIDSCLLLGVFRPWGRLALQLLSHQGILLARLPVFSRMQACVTEALPAKTTQWRCSTDVEGI
jgi:hypothetical protein